MTRAEKWLVSIIVFLCVLLTLFILEHIWLVQEYQRNPAPLLDPCQATQPKPVSKP